LYKWIENFLLIIFHILFAIFGVSMNFLGFFKVWGIFCLFLY